MRDNYQHELMGAERHNQLTRSQQEAPTMRLPTRVVRPRYGREKTAEVRLCPPVRSNYRHVNRDRECENGSYVPGQGSQLASMK
jgi:hypothetical protein